MSIQDQDESFAAFVRAVQECVEKSEMPKLERALLDADVYEFIGLCALVSERVLDFLLRIAVSPSFLAARGSDVLYSFLIGKQHRLSKPQIAKILATIADTYGLVSDPVTVYVMADFAGSASPDGHGLALLNRLSQARNARHRECSLVGLYRLYENCDDPRLLEGAASRIKDLARDPDEGVRTEASRLVRVLDGGAKRRARHQ